MNGLKTAGLVRQPTDSRINVPSRAGEHTQRCMLPRLLSWIGPQRGQAQKGRHKNGGAERHPISGSSRDREETD
jgi:hypothetical protein